MADIFTTILNGIQKKFADLGTHHAEVVVAVNADGSPIGGSSPTPDRELVVSTYCVKTAFTGASVGDTVTATQIIDVSGATPTTIATIWRNQTTAADLASAPSAVNLSLTGATALTSAQLMAAGLALESTQGQINTRILDIRAAVGDMMSNPADSDTGGASVIALIKRALQNWTTLLSRIPAALTPGLLPVDTLGTPGTPRVQATSSTAANITLTATCRRVSMYATAGAWYSIGGTANTSSHFIAEGERLDFDVPANTAISVLQDTAAGSIRVTELA